MYELLIPNTDNEIPNVPGNKLILLDTSFKRKFCRRGREEQWDKAIEMGSKHLTCFENKDFEICPSTAGILEDIGLGQFREEHQDSIILAQDWRHYCSQQVPGCVESVFKQEIAQKYFLDVENHVRKFFYRELTADFLLQTAKEAIEKYPYHELAKPIQEDILKWMLEIQKPEFYIEFIESIIWDTLFRYPYIDETALTQRNEQAIRLHKGIYHILAYHFLCFHEAGHNINGLSLFATIEKAYCQIEKSWSKDKELIRPWDDMMDPELSYYSALGYYRRGARHVVTVVLSENHERVIKRLQLQHDSLQELRRHGFPITGTPGYLMNFDPHDRDKCHFIDLKNFQKLLNQERPF